MERTGLVQGHPENCPANIDITNSGYLRKEDTDRMTVKGRIIDSIHTGGLEGQEVCLTDQCWGRTRHYLLK
jgi:hypothetical protein